MRGYWEPIWHLRQLLPLVLGESPKRSLNEFIATWLVCMWCIIYSDDALTSGLDARHSDLWKLYVAWITIAAGIYWKYIRCAIHFCFNIVIYSFQWTFCRTRCTWIFFLILFKSFLYTYWFFFITIAVFFSEFVDKLIHSIDSVFNLILKAHLNNFFNRFRSMNGINWFRIWFNLFFVLQIDAPIIESIV